MDPPTDMPGWRASFAFALPTEPVLGALAAASPHGVIEIGAGTGYWARLLHDRGVDVVAFDIAPPPSAANTWFAGVTPWYPVQVGDESAVALHPRRTLLLVWPTRNEDCGANAVERFAASGGQQVAFVGETIGGRTGDDRLHALLGALDRCWSCAFGTQTSACVCGIRPQWRCTRTIDLPHTQQDQLRLFTRVDSPPLAPTPAHRSGSPWHRRLGEPARRARRRPLTQ